MNIIDNLASSKGRKDELPNHELAKEIVRTDNTGSITELVELLSHKRTAIQNDVIKVLYEVGESKPHLIVPYISEFVIQLSSKNNRMIWGAMTALDTVVFANPTDIYKHLTTILDAMDKGSVITKDHGVVLLAKLSSIDKYEKQCFSLLLEQLIRCSAKQLPMYAEKSKIAVNDKNSTAFKKVLLARYDDLEKESQRKRIAKVLKKLG